MPTARKRRVAGSARDDPQFAQTLERGLRVLQCFNAAEPTLGNAELSAMTGLPKPTVTRLTYTLVELGYLRRRNDSPRFEVGAGVLCLGYPVLARLAFRRVALPHLVELATALDGVVAISVRDRLRMVTLENAIVRDIMRRRPEPGFTLPFIGSTVGRGWMVGATASERERLFREVARDAPAELDRVHADYQQGIRQAGSDGFVLLKEAVRPGTAAIATTLRRRPGDELLVLSAALEFPAAQATRLIRRAGHLLIETSRVLSAELLNH